MDRLAKRPLGAPRSSEPRNRSANPSRPKTSAWHTLSHTGGCYVLENTGSRSGSRVAYSRIMSGALGTLGARQWAAVSLLVGTAIACSSSSSSSSTNVFDGSTMATGGSTESGGAGGAAGSLSSGGTAGSSPSGGTAGAGGNEVCLVCGGASGAGGKIGSGGVSSGGSGGSSTGGVPAFCATPTTNWLPSMKTCQSDADCKVVPTYSCCGPGTIYGVATSSVPQFSQCFMTSPPQGCPPLGCASEARTEDNQPYTPASFGDLSGVEARCVDNGGGTKECTSTLRGSCTHNVTRCAAGDVCSNPCGASCACQSGYVNCPRPTGTCTSTSAVCEYAATPGSQTVTSCTCPSPGAPWSCAP